MIKKCNLCLLALVIGFAFLLQNCQEEDSTILEKNVISTELSSKKDKDKIDVCHLDKKTGVWNLINISKNAIPEHKLIGDIIIDEDGDGFALENECGLLNEKGIDCDDANARINPDAKEICGDGIDNNCNGETDECTYVPDDKFEKYLETHAADGTIVTIGAINSMGNGIYNDNYVFKDNINSVTSLDVSLKGIIDLTGIEDFNALTFLNCSGIKYDDVLTRLDLSQNTALTSLDCSNNILASLDLSKNTALTYLNFSYTRLTSLDLSKNTALTSLDCSNTMLTSLDLSKNTALTYLNCSDSGGNGYPNQLISLDLSKNTELTHLVCKYNSKLTSLDLSKNTALTYLNFHFTRLTSLDLSQNTTLTSLDCSYTSLTSLDVSQNTALTYLDCSFTRITSLDLSKNTELMFLDFFMNSYLAFNKCSIKVTQIQLDNMPNTWSMGSSSFRPMYCL